MRYNTLLFVALLCLQTNFVYAENWVDASYTDVAVASYSASPRISDALFNRLSGRLSYQALTQFYSSSAFRYNNGVLQSDSDKVFELNLFDSPQSSTGTTVRVNVVQLRVATLLTYLGDSLEVPAVIQAMARVIVCCQDVNTDDVYYLPIIQCLEYQYAWNDFTPEVIDNVRFNLSASNWQYPIFVQHSVDGSVTVGAYMEKNSSMTPQISPILNAAGQTRNNSYQLPGCWFVSWLYGFNGDLFHNNENYRKYNRPWILYDLDANHIIAGTKPLHGIAGYIVVAPETIENIGNGDYDRGGQLDVSEYVLGKDMKDPTDDSPNTEQEMGSIITVLPPNTDTPDFYEHPFEEPTTESVEDEIEEVGEGVMYPLNRNEGYNLLKFLINPVGFPSNVPLPRWQKDMSFEVLGTRLDIGYIDIDLGFIHEEPYWPFWEKIRSMLVLSIYIMTFLACYKIYEKALAFSA